MLIKVKYNSVKKFVHLNTSDSAEEFIVRVRNKFMAEVGDEKIKFRDLDDTEIDFEDLIEYIMEKQSYSFILNIFKETSAATAAAIDQLFDINIPVLPIEEYLQNSASISSVYDDIKIYLSPVKQYPKTAEGNISANTFSACDDIKICVSPVKQYPQTAKENVSANTSSACDDVNICTSVQSPVKQYLKFATENISLLSQDPKKVINKALNKTAIGRNLLEEYEVSATLKPESRRALVRLIVGHMQEQHGIIPNKNVKIFYAKGIVENFPKLQDPSTAEGYKKMFQTKVVWFQGGHKVVSLV